MKDFQMKKMFFIFFIILVVGATVYANQIELFVGTGYNYDDPSQNFVETTYTIIYDTESDEYYFYTSGLFSSGWIIFDVADFEVFRKNLFKYKEWEQIALTNQAEIEKELIDSQITGDVIWQSAQRWHTGKNIAMDFIFFSQSKDRHQLVITSNAIKSSLNESISFELKPIYLTSAQVDAMITGLSNASISQRVDEYAQLKNIESLFQ